MTPPVRALLDRAEEALAAARYNETGGFLTTAVNRIYYAAFYAARAALLNAGETPNTHNRVLRRFLLLFVQSGRVEDAHARALPRAFQLRQEADYDDGDVIEREAVAELLAEVEDFVSAIRVLLAA